MKDLDQAVIGFREHARSFGADRAIAAGRLLGAVVGPFVDWLSSMSDIVSFFVYRVGGYDCIGFRVNWWGLIEGCAVVWWKSPQQVSIPVEAVVCCNW
jgi:hypothetical protein